MKYELPAAIGHLVLCLFLVAPGEPAKVKDKLPEEQDVAGFYHCVGQDDKDEYEGIVTIHKMPTKLHRYLYRVSWQLEGTNFVGLGKRSGDKLVVAWAGDGPRGILLRGLHEFVIATGKEGPTLKGKWISLPGSGNEHEETLTFLRPLGGK